MNASLSTNTFRHSQFGTAAAWVFIRFRIAWKDRLLGENLQLGAFTHRMLYNPVFQRMERDHQQSTARGEAIGEAFNGGFQVLQLIIDGDTKSLECSSRTIDTTMDFPTGDTTMDQIRQILGRSDW